LFLFFGFFNFIFLATEDNIDKERCNTGKTGARKGIQKIPPVEIR